MKRRKVLDLIERLHEVPFTKTGWKGDKFHGVLLEDKQEAIKYLREYAEGGHLK